MATIDNSLFFFNFIILYSAVLGHDSKMIIPYINGAYMCSDNFE